MITACVIIIGNEILSGRTQEANLAVIAKELNELGVQVTEARVVPDVATTIINTVNEVRVKFDYVFTTGGIGPTHDDITADCIAEAFGLDMIMHPEAEAIIRQRDVPEDIMRSRLRMARIPEGAILIKNEYGPPGFQVENVFVLAGVPMVARAMLRDLPGKVKGDKPFRSITLGAYLGESQVAAGLAEIQSAIPQVDLGSYPFYKNERYGTNLVMRGTDREAMSVMADRVRQLIVDCGEQAVEGGI